MRKTIAAAAGLALCLPAFAHADVLDELTRTPMTLPGRYLKRVPIGEASKIDVFDSLGAPVRETELGERVMWTYEDRSESAAGFSRSTTVTQWIYVFEGDTLVDVRLVGGAGRRDSARERQGLD